MGIKENVKDELTPARYFASVVPRAILANPEHFCGMGGTLSWCIAGAGWTINFGDVEAPIVNGASPRADLWMELTTEAFQSFVDGSLSPQAALANGELSMHGDQKMLQQFAEILMPQQSVLQTRIARNAQR